MSVALLTGCADFQGSEADDASAGDGSACQDGGCEGGAPDAGGDGDTDAGTNEAGLGSAACKVDLDCPAAEVCVDLKCVAPKSCDDPCTDVHPCDPHTGMCRCDDPDADADGDVALACANAKLVGGDLEKPRTDCDDGDPKRHPARPERCFDPEDPDAEWRDEDCDPSTFAGPDGDGDADGDGQVSARCVNFGPGGMEARGEDCDDRNAANKKGNTEVCDFVDNNCNGMVDERPHPDTGELIAAGLQRTIYRDADFDGFGDAAGQTQAVCFFDRFAYPGFADNPDDCDDAEGADDVYPGAPELCDGKDNDCDGDIDTEDDEFDIDLTAEIPEHSFQCLAGGELEVTCPSPDVVACGAPEDGCETDATRLTSCRACESDCVFSCGAEGCDEIADVSAGTDHVCALTDEGRVACWGRALHGRLGHETVTSSQVPLFNPRVGGAAEVHRVAAGHEHTCSIVGSDREVWCWGNNRDRQAGGDPEVLDTVVPIAVRWGAGRTPDEDDAVLSGANLVAAGGRHSCAVLDEGHLVCWGSGEDGRLGDTGDTEARNKAETAQRLIPPDDFFPFETYEDVNDLEDLDLGFAHGCSIRAGGTVECWGANDAGQLGDGRTALPAALSLQAVPDLAAVAAEDVACGYQHTCIIASGEVYCWGANGSGQLGPRDADALGNDGVDDDRPGHVAGITDAEEVVAGYSHTCVKTGTGAIVCWGDNDFGQLGGAPDGSGFAVLDDPAFAQPPRALAASGDFTCALAETGALYCWGSNGFGQQGTGQIQARNPHPFSPVLPALRQGQ